MSALTVGFHVILWFWNQGSSHDK